MVLLSYPLLLPSSDAAILFLRFGGQVILDLDRPIRNLQNPGIEGAPQLEDPKVSSLREPIPAILHSRVQ